MQDEAWIQIAEYTRGNRHIVVSALISAQVDPLWKVSEITPACPEGQDGQISYTEPTEEEAWTIADTLH